VRGRKRQPIVIFENISRVQYPFLMWYLLNGAEAGYLISTRDLSESILFGRYVSSGRLSRIPSGSFNLNTTVRMHRRIPEIAEDYLKHEAEISRISRVIQSFVGSPFVDLAFQKFLATELVNHCQNELPASLWVEEHQSSRDVIYIPAARTDRANAPSSPSWKVLREGRIHVPLWARALNRLWYLIEKAGWMVIYCLFPLWIGARVGIPSLSPPPRKEFQLGIRAYRTDIGWRNRFRSIDFILDGQCIHAENTIFCLETAVSPDYMHQLVERGYQFVDVHSALHHADLEYVKGTVIQRFLPVWFRGISHTLRLSPLMIRLTMEIFDQYLSWGCFFRKYRVRSYISYNDFLPRSIIRNLVFHENGVESYYFIHSSHFMNVFMPRDQEELQNVEFLYLYFDYLVSWGKKVSRAFQFPRNHIREYAEVGCLWSEQIMRIAKTARPVEIREDISHRVYKRSWLECKKIIGVYDTSFGPETPLQGIDMIRFIEGILCMVDRYPEVAVILKNKNPWDEIAGKTPEIMHYYQRLQLHPRCFFASDLDLSSEEIIASSDLIVAACFTAPGVEALGARRKALYFDPTGKFRRTYFDTFPQLVAHSLDDLCSLVRYWIYEIPDSEFDRFLEETIKGEIDAFVDGKGLTRFREMLCRGRRNSTK
jgi:polysaccharide biosynthesis PFTS motif protein